MLRSRLFWVLTLPILGIAAALTVGAITIAPSPGRTILLLLMGIALALAGAGWVAWQAVHPVRRSLTRLRAAAPAEIGAPASSSNEAMELVELASALAGWHSARTAARDAQRGRLDALIDAQDDPAFLADFEGRIERCNGAAMRVFSSSSRSLAGRSLRELFTRADVIELIGAAQSGRRARQRTPLPTPTGERVFEIVVTPLDTPRTGNAPIAMILRDVTELAETMRVKTDFVANASHELRTPLAAIRAGVETLVEGAKSDPRMLDRVLEMIAGHVARLEDLTRDLLDLSRVEQTGLTLRVEPLIVAKLVDGLRAELDPAVRKRSLQLEFDIEPTIDGVETDPRLLFVVLRNLLDNATKFCHERTTVTVRARWSEAPSPEPDRRVARFEVRDRGIGIPLAQQQRVFERFYQVDPGRSGLGAQRRGTGLGLAIARHAVRALGGRIGVDSVWMQGSTFWFEVPTPPIVDGADAHLP